MNKQYFRYLLKQWLPLIIVPFFLLITPCFIVSMVTDCYSYKYHDGYTGAIPWAMMIALTFLVVASVIFSSILPLFVESYRFGKRSADTYYSLPFKPLELRKTRMFLALGILLVVFSLAYWIPSGIYYIRYASISAPSEDYIKDRLMDPLWLTAAYGTLLVLLSANFFVSSFFVRLGNSPLSSIILLLAGHAILCGLLPTIGLWISLIAGMADWTSSFLTIVGMQNYGASFPVFLFIFAFFSPMSNSGVLSQAITELPNQIALSISLIVVLSSGALSLIYLLNKKDPSGEFSGAPASHFHQAIYLIFVAFLLSAILSSSSGGSIGSGFAITSALGIGSLIASFVFLGVGQYIVYLLYLKKAALDKKSWILISINQGALLLFSIISVIATAIRG